MPIGSPLEFQLRNRSALLAGLDPLDAPAFLAAAALVTLMTLGGSLLPAWRAVRVNPMTVMRTE